MAQSKLKNVALSAVALAALACAGAAQAATDYLLKIEGVPGESKIVAGSGGGAMPHVKGDARHKGWIELDSVQLGAQKTAAGGVNVASGDVDGVKAPRDVATGQSSGKRTHKPVMVIKQTDEETAALLLPAVQKIREAAARMTPWTGCTAGQKIEAIAIKQKSTGREGKILDATVTACAAETVSFNFSKIEWK